MNSKREVGKKFENVAKDFLIKKGYSIIETNFFAKYGEIDIVAKDKEYLVFVEVKYRGKKRLASGLTAVDRKKQKRIISAAKYYIYMKRIIEHNTPCRFDVVSIDGDIVTHIKNAF